MDGQPLYSAVNPFYWGTDEGHLKIVRLLIDFEADINQPNKEGKMLLPTSK